MALLNPGLTLEGDVCQRSQRRFTWLQVRLFFNNAYTIAFTPMTLGPARWYDSLHRRATFIDMRRVGAAGNVKVSS
jgi:hypothetical protein